MSLEDFLNLVVKMRRAQRRYFASKRSSDALAEARALEQKVDRACEAMAAQPGLFEEERGDG